MEDPAKAELAPRVRATLVLLAKVTQDHAALTAEDLQAVLSAGATKAQIADALVVGYCFNIITRLADAFEFYVGPKGMFDASAKFLLKRGYK